MKNGKSKETFLLRGKNRSILKQPRPPTSFLPKTKKSSLPKTGPDLDASPSPSSSRSSAAGPQRAPLGPPRAGRGRPGRGGRPHRPALRRLPRRLGARRHRRRRLRLRVRQQERHLRRAAAREPAVRADPRVVRADGPAFGRVAVLQGREGSQRGGGEAGQGWFSFFLFFLLGG